MYVKNISQFLMRGTIAIIIFSSLQLFATNLSPAVGSDEGGFPVICPQDVTVDCLAYTWDPADYGSPIPLNNGYVPTIVGPNIVSTLNSCGIGVITKTWSIYTYHEVYTCTQRIYVVRPYSHGSQNPVITWPPNYTINGCDANVAPENLPAPYNRPWVGNGNAPCGNMYAWTYKDWVFTSPNGGCKKILRDWTVIDWCTYERNNPHTGGIWTYQQEIVVMDNIPPTISCNTSVVASVDNNTCYKGYVKVPIPVAYDNCGIVTVTNSSAYSNSKGADASGTYPLGTTQVIFTAKDACGNTQTCITYVTVRDLIKPKVYCIAKLSTTLMPDPNGNPMIRLADNALDRGSDDNCTPQKSLVFRMEPNNFTCDHLGLNTVRMYVTDQSGNTDYCVATVEIQANMAVCPPDTIPPTISCPSYNTLSGFLHRDSCNTQYMPIPDVTVSDNRRTTVTITNNSPFAFSNGASATGNYPVGGTNVTFTATDASGNRSFCTIRVLIADTTKPIARCKNVELKLQSSSNGPLAILTPEMINNNSFDNCAHLLNLTVQRDRFSCSDIGTHTVKLYVTDRSGNSDWCDATVTVRDSDQLCLSQVRLVNCPSDTMIIVPKDSCQGVYVHLNPAGAVLGVGTASIRNNSIYSSQNGSNASGHYPIGSNLITYTAVDSSGRSYSCQSRVTLLEDEAPVANCYNGIVLNLYSDSIRGGFVALSPSQINRASFDNCSASGNLALSVSPASFNCSNIGINDVTLTVSDQSGNTDYCITSVTITDTLQLCHMLSLLNSGAMCPSNITVNLPSNVCNGLDLTLPNGFPREMSNLAITSNYGRSSLVSGFFNQGINTVIYSIPAMGNTYTCTQLVIVRDNTAPIVSCKNGQSFVFQPDFGKEYMTLDPMRINRSTTDNCTPFNELKFEIEPAVVTCQMLGVRQVKLYATDTDGNRDYCTANISITDPEGLCATSLVLNENGENKFDAQNVNNITDETGRNIINTEKLSIQLVPKFEVYPNPFSQSAQIYFETKFEEIGNLLILDMQGKLVRNTRVNLRKGGNTFEINSEDLKGNGLYYIQILTPSLRKGTKVILNH